MTRMVRDPANVDKRKLAQKEALFGFNHEASGFNPWAPAAV